MRNITITNTTQITRVRFASPQPANRSLTVSLSGAFYAPMQRATAVKDVASLRAWRPPV